MRFAIILLLLSHMGFSQTYFSGTAIAGYASDTGVIVCADSKSKVITYEVNSLGEKIKKDSITYIQKIKNVGYKFFAYAGTTDEVVDPYIKSLIAQEKKLRFLALILRDSLKILLQQRYDTIKLENRDYYIENILKKPGLAVTLFGVDDNRPQLYEIRFMAVNEINASTTLITNIVAFPPYDAISASGAITQQDAEVCMANIFLGKDPKKELINLILKTGEKSDKVGGPTRTVRIDKNGTVYRD